MSAKIKSTFFYAETDLAHSSSHEEAAIGILWKIPTIRIGTVISAVGRRTVSIKYQIKYVCACL